MPKKVKAESTFTTVQVRRTTNKKIKRAKIKSKYILTADDIISSALDLYLKRQREDEEFV